MKERKSPRHSRGDFDVFRELQNRREFRNSPYILCYFAIYLSHILCFDSI